MPRRAKKIELTVTLDQIVPGKFYTTKEFAALTRRSPKTIANDRLCRRGLPYIKQGKGKSAKVVYLGQHIIEYLKSCVIVPVKKK